jgi:signal transduction histidine kinase
VKFENKIFFTGILHDLSDIKQAEKKIIQLNEELEKKVQSRTEELNDAINKLLEFNHELKKQIHERELIAMALTESEEELKRALSKEQELNELKSKFISLASHEFRTPLSSILSSANLLKRYITPENKERKDRHLDRIKRSVENLNGILEDILSLSKLEEGMINTQFADFNLEDFFEDLLDEMSAIMKPGQEFKTDFLAACMIIHSDVRILHNICVNLLSNAIKYSKQDSKITIDLKCDSNYLNISIIDEGVGIPLNEQKHLFTRFYRGSNVTNIKGTGLGLNIVEKYVELLNGTISFESVPGKGSTFKIILPKQVGKKREVASN